MTNKIKQTNYYKSLNYIAQKLVIKYNNLKLIEHGVKVCENVGFERWEEITNYNDHNYNIIKEIYESSKQRLHD